jgi:hypothetical protein
LDELVDWKCGKTLAPVTANLLARKFMILEYKAIKVEPHGKAFRNLNKPYVLDIKNNEISFVIDNVNGVERE